MVSFIFTSMFATGARLAVMEMKTIMYHLVLRFRFVRSVKTDVPVKMKNLPIRLQGVRSMNIELQPR